jgi:hypothetical protein
MGVRLCFNEDCCLQRIQVVACMMIPGLVCHYHVQRLDQVAHNQTLDAG